METEDKVDILKGKIQERKKEWFAWHKKNPSIWVAFQKFSLEATASKNLKYQMTILLFTLGLFVPNIHNTKSFLGLSL